MGYGWGGTSRSCTRRFVKFENWFSVRYRFYPLWSNGVELARGGVRRSIKEVVPVKDIGIQYMGVISAVVKWEAKGKQNDEEDSSM